MVDALKSSEFSGLRRLAVFNVLSHSASWRAPVVIGVITKSRPFRIGEIADFHADMIGGITEYRGRILPNMSIPPPIVNDMSLISGKAIYSGSLLDHRYAGKPGKYQYNETWQDLYRKWEQEGSFKRCIGDAVLCARLPSPTSGSLSLVYNGAEPLYGSHCLDRNC